MKNIKSFACICLSIVLLFVINFPCFAIQSDYDYLINCGFDEDYLDSLSSDLRYHMRKLIDNNVVTSIDYKKSSFDLDKDDNDTTRAALKEDDFIMDIVCSNICSSGSNVVNGVLVGISWEWLDSEPVIRQTDSITVNWDSTLFDFVSDSFLSQDMYRFTYSPQEWIVGEEYTRASESMQGSIGYYTSLFGDTPTHSVSNKGATIFILQPRSKIVVGKDYNTSINVNYVHNANLLIPSFGFDTSGLTVGVDTLLFSEQASDTYNYKYSK